MNYKCPCCDFYTFAEPLNGEYNICPVCFWEDDPFAYDDPNEECSCNGVSLNQARKNFAEFSACRADMKQYVRSPLAHELTGEDLK